MDFHGFHGRVSFSRTTPNFTENVTAVKSQIRLVPNDTRSFVFFSLLYSPSVTVCIRDYLHALCDAFGVLSIFLLPCAILRTC